MSLEPCIARLCDYIKQGIVLDTVTYETVISHIELCNSLFEKALEPAKCETGAKVSRKEPKCLKCNETDIKLFNRKKTECVPCMSKAGYVKIKAKIEQGKERNILARLSREKCSVCSLIVTRENAQMFDWDHRNPSEKTCAIAKMNYKSDELFVAEIAKCDLTCRNCHSMRTMQQYKDNEIPKRKSTKKSESA